MVLGLALTFILGLPCRVDCRAKIYGLGPSPLDTEGRVSKEVLTILTTIHLDPDLALLITPDLPEQEGFVAYRVF